MWHYFPIWNLLDRIRGGFFQLVSVLPPNATWTRQLRSRRFPFGLESLGLEASQLVLHANACVRTSSHPQSVILACPASIWSCHEYQMLERLHEAKRGAACLCQLSSADHRGPWGVVSDIPNLLARLWPGWPLLKQESTQLVYQGPLPKSCRYAAKGAVSATVQNAADTILMGSLFWQRCLFDWTCTFMPDALRDGLWYQVPLRAFCLRTSSRVATSILLVGGFSSSRLCLVVIKWSHSSCRLVTGIEVLRFSWTACVLWFLSYCLTWGAHWCCGRGWLRDFTSFDFAHSCDEEGPFTDGQTPLASEPRGDGHFCDRTLFSLPAESGSTYGRVPGSCSYLIGGILLRLEVPTSSRLQSSLLSGGQSPHARAGAGYGSSHRSSTSCPRADGTTSLKSVARTLMKRRVIPLTGRSRTPRRSQTTPGLRAEERWRWPGESGLTDISCELPLC